MIFKENLNIFFIFIKTEYYDYEPKHKENLKHLISNTKKLSDIYIEDIHK